MTITEMPAAEHDVDASLVHALLREQHSDLAGLPLVDAGHGWDNSLYRLGDDLLVRLPRRRASADLIEQECRWLPELAPRLPMATPVPLRIGRPGCGYPWAWSITLRASVRGSSDAIDDDTWMRARGWALALGLAYLAHSRDNADMGAVGRATLDAVLLL